LIQSRSEKEIFLGFWEVGVVDVVLWEYRVVNQTDSHLENQAKLNRLGQEGWELVAVSPLGNAGVLAAYLKRSRNSNGNGTADNQAAL
jgi:hypothetical protein